MIMQVSVVITGNVIALPPHFSVPVAVNTCRLKFQTPVPRLARRVDTSRTAERYCNFFGSKAVLCHLSYADQKVENVFAAWRWLQA
jgi:hypothetical protein